MNAATPTPEVSVIVPARNEADCLADCLRSLVGQPGASYEVIVVDDYSTDGTRAIAESFSAPNLSQEIHTSNVPGSSYPAVRVITADALPPGWSGKCNAALSGAKVAKGKWLLFTDADTRHSGDSIARALREAQEYGADMLSYSPKQEVASFAERALMPVIFAELATQYPPKAVSDPKSPVAAANGQYLLIKREVYDTVGGHAAVAMTILEDVALAKLIKRAGYKLRFRVSDAVTTRMYRSVPQMLEGWTKNLALLFPHAPSLAMLRTAEFALITGGALAALTAGLERKPSMAAAATAVAGSTWLFFLRRIRRAHFDWVSNALAIFGLPLFAVLLLNSDISHRRGSVRWKGREYSPGAKTGSSDGNAGLRSR